MTRGARLSGDGHPDEAGDMATADRPVPETLPSAYAAPATTTCATSTSTCRCGAPSPSSACPVGRHPSGELTPQLHGAVSRPPHAHTAEHED